MRASKTEKSIGGKTYWSSAKAADYMGVAKATLLAKARCKAVTYLDHGGCSWFLKEWLDSYLSRATIIGNGK